MEIHHNVRSTIRPDTVSIDAYSVYVATNVKDITVTDTMGEEELTHTEYEYTITRYSKDEYIKLKLSEQEDAILELADLIGGML